MLILLTSAVVTATALGATPSRSIQIQDNTRAVGQLNGTVATIRMVAGLGDCRPKGQAAAPLEVAAFGEEGKGLSVPGPLIRAREGTEIVLTVRNALPRDLRVFGLCDRPGPCPALTVPD